MTENYKKARELLNGSCATCVLCKDEQVITSELSGIAPMLGFIGDGTDLRGFSAADRIVGRAASMLFALAGVSEVYGEVMSREALPVLEKYCIEYGYGELTDYIVNRAGDGMCPMEKAVAGINSPADGYAALEKRLSELQAGI